MEQLIVGLFLALFILEFIVEFGLNELNLRYVRAHWAEKRIPDFFQRNMGAAEYEKSVDYTLVKGQVSALGGDLRSTGCPDRSFWRVAPVHGSVLARPSRSDSPQ